MNSLTSSCHNYPGIGKIEFSFDLQKGLSVTINTDYLLIKSVEATEAEYSRYVLLYSDEEVMKNFATGETKPIDQVVARINTLAKRWLENDPFSGLSVFEKSTGRFVGTVVLGHGDIAGQSELAGLGHQSFWHKGYGKEAAKAMVQGYAPALIEKGYLLEGNPLKTIVATARKNNTFSLRILNDIGMHFDHEEQKYGALRDHYKIDLNDSRQQSSKRAEELWNVLL